MAVSTLGTFNENSEALGGALSALGIGGLGGLGGLFGANNPYQEFGFPCPVAAWQQFTHTVETTSSGDGGLVGPPLTPTVDSLQQQQRQTVSDEVMRQPQNRPRPPVSYICPEGTIVRCWPPALSRLGDWFHRVDKVEFWASVVIVGYYLAHCVLGVV